MNRRLTLNISLDTLKLFLNSRLEYLWTSSRRLDLVSKLWLTRVLGPKTTVSWLRDILKAMKVGCWNQHFFFFKLRQLRAYYLNRVIFIIHKLLKLVKKKRIEVKWITNRNNLYNRMIIHKRRLLQSELL